VHGRILSNAGHPISLQVICDRKDTTAQGKTSVMGVVFGGARQIRRRIGADQGTRATEQGRLKPPNLANTLAGFRPAADYNSMTSGRLLGR